MHLKKTIMNWSYRSHHCFNFGNSCTIIIFRKMITYYKECGLGPFSLNPAPSHTAQKTFPAASYQLIFTFWSQGYKFNNPKPDCPCPVQNPGSCMYSIPFLSATPGLHQDTPFFPYLSTFFTLFINARRTHIISIL